MNQDKSPQETYKNSPPKKMNRIPKNIDEYIAGAPKEIRDALVQLRRVIKKAALRAIERISYGMPFYEYGVRGTKGGSSILPYSKNISVYLFRHLSEEATPGS